MHARTRTHWKPHMHCLYTHQGHIISLIYINKEKKKACDCLFQLFSSLPLDIVFFLHRFSSRPTVLRLCVLSRTVCHPGASRCLSWLRVSPSQSQVLLIPSKFDVCVGGCARRRRRREGKCDSVSSEPQYFFFYQLMRLLEGPHNCNCVECKKKNEREGKKKRPYCNSFPITTLFF